MTNPNNLTAQKPNKLETFTSKRKIAISKSALQSGKLGQQQYDDVINRKFEKYDRLIDQAPGNGD